MKNRCRDVQFVGVLSEPLRPGEDPAGKLSALKTALGTSSDCDALILLASDLGIPGFQLAKPKNRAAGRPTLFWRIQQVDPDGITNRPMDPIVLGWIEDAVLTRMEKIQAEGKAVRKVIKILDAAFRVISEQEIHGETNWFHVPPSVPRTEREAYAKSLASFYTHRRRRRAAHAVACEPLRKATENHIRNLLWPHREEVMPELTRRMQEEAATRHAAGDSFDDILKDLPERARLIMSELFSPYLREN